MKVSLEDGVAEMISEYTMEGRKAVNLLADAYSLAVYEAGGAGKIYFPRNHAPHGKGKPPYRIAS